MKKLLLTSVLTLGCLQAFAGSSGMKTGNEATGSKEHVVDGMKFIDMGTSVLWADQPMGVDEEHPYGNLYKSGATAPYPESSNFISRGFNLNEWGGNIEYDVATVTYGKGVSTPSKAQFEELLKVCEFTYNYNYDLKRYEMTLTSNVTGNKIVVVGAGYYLYDNDETADGTLNLNTSSGIAGSNYICYCMNPLAYSNLGIDKALWPREEGTAHAYQILPVYNAADVVKATSVTFNTTEINMLVGDVATITATIVPEDVTVKKLQWKASDEAVATVSADGQVTGVGAGECTVTATTTDGTDITATCKVTVQAASATEMKTVDMGVSVLWGESEIGATDYLQAGTYYAWGTVENANNWEAAIESAYSPKNITTAVTSVPRDPSDPTKAYDVAMDVLGNEWHTPTIDEWNELIENCEITKIFVDGKGVARFTSKINGNSIYFSGHGYLRETSANGPSMNGSIILQTSDAAKDNIYTAIYMRTPEVQGLARQCFWLVPIRPVYGDKNAAIGSVITDNSRDGIFDVYDISGRSVLAGTTYEEAYDKLPSGIYIFAGRDGRRIKVAL